MSGATGPAGPAGAAGASYLRTVVVSPSGADAQADGALLAAAVASISSSSAASPWLVWVEPGVYDLGGGMISLPPHVDLEGSGQDATTISGSGPRVLVAGSASEIRALSVSDVDKGGSSAIAIDTQSGLRDVTAFASATASATAVLADGPGMPLLDVTGTATTTDVASVAVGVDVRNGAARLDGGAYSATDSQSGEAIGLLAESGASLNDVALSASGTNSVDYPVDLVGSGVAVTIQDSVIGGTGGMAVGTGDTLDVAASQVPRVVSSMFGTASCPDDWLDNYATAATNCS